jgi:uncharacterized membrane protein
MMDDMTVFKTLDPVVDHAIRVVGSGIEAFGVLIIVTGIAWSTYRQLRQRMSEQESEVYKIRIGRSLLLGLEVLVAADIVKTIAHEFDSHEPHPARWARAGSHLSELDAGVGNRWPLAMAAGTVTHVTESSCCKRNRRALKVRCADPPQLQGRDR